MPREVRVFNIFISSRHLALTAVINGFTVFSHYSRTISNDNGVTEQHLCVTPNPGNFTKNNGATETSKENANKGFKCGEDGNCHTLMLVGMNRRDRRIDQSISLKGPSQLIA